MTKRPWGRPEAGGRAGQRPGGRPGGRQGRPERRERHPDDPIVLYGWHPVAEALRNEARGLRRLLATENATVRIADEIGEIRIVPELVTAGEITRLLEPDAVHQGLYLEADPLPSPSLETLPDDALVVALDQVTDPHNVGAVVRTAAAFGVTAILTTARHSPATTGVLAKAASGGLEHVPFVTVRNLAEAMIALGERGFLRIGLDSEAPADLHAVTPRRPLLVVLGAEGKGLRERTRACCDVLARLPLEGKIRSLNVSNAGAIALYALSRRSPG